MAIASDMTPGEALRRAKEAGLAGGPHVVLTRHARERMDLREVDPSDVYVALRTSKSASWRPDDSSWRLSGGNDCANQPLELAIAFNARVVVITVIRPGDDA